MNTENPTEHNENMASTKKGTDSRTVKIILALALVCTVISFIYRSQSDPIYLFSKDKSKGKDAASTTDQNEFAYTLNDVNHVLDEQLKGWNNGNIEQFMEGYVKDSSVRFITNKRVKTSWQEITDSYKKNYPNKDAMGKLSFHRDEVRWVNKIAHIAQVIGRWEVIQKHKAEKSPSGSMIQNGNPMVNKFVEPNAPSFDTLSGRFSLIFVGTPNGPKIQIDHTW